MSSTIYIVSPTESVLTVRGKRHPNLAEVLTSRGVMVTYCTTDFDHARKLIFSFEECLHAQEKNPYAFVFVHPGKYTKHLSLERMRWNIRTAWLMWRELQHRVKANDVVVVPSRPCELVYMAYRLKRKTKCKIFVDIRDVWPDSLPRDKRVMYAAFSFYCSLLLRRSIRVFDGCFHVSPNFLAWLNRYASGKSSTFLPLGFDERRWSGCRSQLPVANQGYRLFYCGTLSVNCPLLPLLEALKDRPPFTLTLAGDSGSGDLYRQTLDYCERYLSGRYEVYGVLPAAEIVRLYSETNIAIVALAGLLLPNKFFDAIASETPMIAIGESAASDLVEQFHLGWVAPQETKAIGKVLDALTPQAVSQAKQRIADFSISYTHKRILSDYADILVKAATTDTFH